MTREPLPEAHAPGPEDAGDRDMTRTYVLVIVVQAVVLLTLWFFSRYFD